MTKRCMVLCVVLAFPVVSILADDAPVRVEQSIYTILAYNGKDFSPTFCREESEAIYLLAGESSVLSFKKAFVYYWPITDDWRTDISVLDREFDGFIEIRDRKGEIRSLDQVDFTYFNVRGVYENNWHVVTGAEAQAEVAKYQKMVTDYMAAADAFRAAKREFEMLFDSIASRITALRNRGEDYSELANVLLELEQPTEPQMSDYYTQTPAKLAKGFVVNLAPGEYDIRFRNLDGSVMEGSEKRLIAFEPAETDGIGYSVIPGDRWTSPVESTTPASVIYVSGATDLYVNPYYQDRVNELYYSRMVKNDSSGNPNILNWVRIQQIPRARIEMYGFDGENVTIHEEPFMVEQTESASLGYRIVPFDADGAHEGYKPSIIAFHLPLADRDSSIKIRLLENESHSPAGSSRQIRIVDPMGDQWPLFILVFFPIGAMIVVLLVRRRRIITLSDTLSVMPHRKI